MSASAAAVRAATAIVCAWKACVRAAADRVPVTR